MAISTELRRLAAAATASLLLAGCASTQKDVIPQDGPDMLEIYRSHMRRAGGASGDAPRAAAARRPLADEPDARFAREAAAEIENRFPLLPNPMLVLYVYPHLAEDGAPVPGYATAFRMYERDEFALPGEVTPP